MAEVSPELSFLVSMHSDMKKPEICLTPFTGAKSIPSTVAHKLPPLHKEEVVSTIIH